MCLALIIGNSDEAIDLALEVAEENPQLLCDSHRPLSADRTLRPWISGCIACKGTTSSRDSTSGRADRYVACEYEDENPLHILAVNRRSDAACRMIRLAAALSSDADAAQPQA